MKIFFRIKGLCRITFVFLVFFASTTYAQEKPLPQTAARPDSTIQNHPVGRAFLFVLPRGTRNGKPFVRYEIVEAPAMSWLIKRSFFWDTDREKSGSSHAIRFRAYTAANEPSEISIVVNLK